MRRNLNSVATVSEEGPCWFEAWILSKIRLKLISSASVKHIDSQNQSSIGKIPYACALAVKSACGKIVCEAYEDWKRTTNTPQLNHYTFNIH